MPKKIKETQVENEQGIGSAFMDGDDEEMGKGGGDGTPGDAGKAKDGGDSVVGDGTESKLIKSGDNESIRLDSNSGIAVEP